MHMQYALYISLITQNSAVNAINVHITRMKTEEHIVPLNSPVDLIHITRKTCRTCVLVLLSQLFKTISKAVISYKKAHRLMVRCIMLLYQKKTQCSKTSETLKKAVWCMGTPLLCLLYFRGEGVQIPFQEFFADSIRGLHLTYL